MFKIFKVFYGFLLKKRFWAIIFGLLMVASPIASSISPYFYKLMVDAIPSMNISLITSILLIFILVKFADVLLHTAEFFVGDILMLDALTDAQSTVFRHIHSLDFAFHTKKSSGSLISSIKRGEGAFFNLFFSTHYRIVDVLIRFIVMLFFFSYINSQILILVSISFVLCIIAAIIFVRENIKYRAEVNNQEDKISGVVVDNMINFETVKLFAKEDWEQGRLRDIFRVWKTWVWKYVFTFRGLDLGMGTIVNLSTYAIYLLALKLTIDKAITIGDFVLIATFTQAFFGQLFELVWGLRDIAKSYSDIERFFGILDNKIEIRDPEIPTIIKKAKGDIKFENVSFAYDENNKCAVSDININIKKGQSVALVGRSGSGKTTLAKLLLRFFDVQKGNISVDGINIKNLKKDNLRSQFGMVPQEPVLFNNTIAYNISYGKTGATKKEIVAASKLANIHKFIRSLPDRYETQVGERGIKLSGGQKQRLAIARMILSNPQIIIFDEATSQLDSESEKLIQDAFWKASEGKTTIIIAHRLSTVQKADKIIVLDKGKIIEQGSHKSLTEDQESLYNHFWNLQIKLN